MVIFNELRITPDNKKLIIDVSINDHKYYENINIEAIAIDTDSTFNNNGPSSNTVYEYQVVNDEEKKKLRLVLSSDDMKSPISNNMFFVYVIVSGEYHTNTPCELKRPVTIGTAVNLYPIYKQAVLYTKELSKDCGIPKKFVDYILRIKAIDLNIKTGNYQEAIRYWNKLFKGHNSTTRPSAYINCECYGKSN